MPAMVDPAILKTTYLAAGLNDAQLAAVGKLAEVKTFVPGHLIEKIGDPAEEMYVVLGGELRVTTYDNDTLGEIGAGNIVGEIALIDTHPRTVNVVCCGHVTVGAFNVKALRHYMFEDKDAGLHILANIARVLAMRLRNADHRIDHLSDKVADVWEQTSDR